jgi:hypothetical protein
MPVLQRHSMDGLAAPAPGGGAAAAALAFGAPAPSLAGGGAPAAGPSGSGSGGGGSGGGTNWAAVVALAALGIVICYADRSNMSTAIIPMAADFGWDKAYQGVVLSAFFLGYATTQILGGACGAGGRAGGRAGGGPRAASRDSSMQRALKQRADPASHHHPLPSQARWRTATAGRRCSPPASRSGRSSRA